MIGEAVVAHFLLHVRRKARRDEGAHQHHRGLALEQERLRAVEIVGQRVVDEVARVDQRFPRRVDLLPRGSVYGTSPAISCW